MIRRTLALADRIVMLDSGGVVEQGTHDELIELGGSYARLYGMYRRQGDPDVWVESDVGDYPEALVEAEGSRQPQVGPSGGL